MYDYYDSGYGASTTSGVLGGMMVVVGVTIAICSVIGLITLISQWIIYKKAGKGGWECIIPIYNIVVLLQIVNLPMWYLFLFLIPIANIYAMFKIYIELAHKFGKSTGFGVATVFFGFVCFPILAFGKNNVYIDDKKQTTTDQQNNDFNNQNTFASETSAVNNEVFNNIEDAFKSSQNINTDINQIDSNEINKESVALINETETINQQSVQNLEVQNPVNLENSTDNQIIEPQPFDYNQQQSEIINQDSQASNISNMENTIPQPMPTQNFDTPNLVNAESTSINQTAPQTFGYSQSEPVSNNQESQINTIPNMGDTVSQQMPTQPQNNYPNNQNM